MRILAMIPWISVIGLLVPSAGSVRGGEEAKQPPNSTGLSTGTPWAVVSLPRPREVVLRGIIGETLDRGLMRLKKGPYDDLRWIRADLDQSKEVNRIFMDWSGDVSGRYIETLSLASRSDRPEGLLAGLLASLPGLQRADGHFGGEIGDPLKLLEYRQQPVFWGNARLLVALVISARELDQPRLLDPARRIGDFFVAVAGAACVAGNEAKWKNDAQDSFSFVTDFFPAVEGLALLYGATRDERYLRAAERMAEFFRKFDREPNGHSHGNLSVWRGILELYHATSDAKYLEQAVGKWDRVVRGGFIWPIGGSGEGWSKGGGLNGAVGGRSITEGCADSDWLRFNLQLWRCTGRTRYLDVAERHLHNQYLADRAPNGGHGHRPVLVSAEGQITGLDGHAACDATWCCTLHGPLGLEYLKSHLAAGSDLGVLVNFPEDFTASVTSRGTRWAVTCRAKPDYLNGRAELAVELSPLGDRGRVPTTLRVRMPDWADAVKVTDAQGSTIPATIANGYVCIERTFAQGDPVRLAYQSPLRLEGRCFQHIDIQPGKLTPVRDAALVAGPWVLCASGRGPADLLMISDAEGRLRLLDAAEGRLSTIALPRLEKTAEPLKSLTTTPPIVMAPCSGTSGPALFMNHWLVVPASLLPEAERGRLAALAVEPLFSAYGDSLERSRSLWNAPAGWAFTSAGLEVARRWAIKPGDLVASCGGVGLLAGQGYRDYRFEFEAVLPKESDGVTGWVVRAKAPYDGILFQIEAADSNLTGKRDPNDRRTRPNTLRSYHMRAAEMGTVLDLEDVVSLPKPVHRGTPHQIATECIGDQIAVFLDGQKIHIQKVGTMTAGSVGFRAGNGTEDGSPGVNEVGLFRSVRLTRL